MKKFAAIFFLPLLIFCGVSGFLFAGGEQEEPEPAGPVQFDFWSTQTQAERQAVIQVLIDSFQAIYPDITVQLIPVDENDLPVQINTAAAAGTLPGMIEGAAENMVAFGSEGFINTSAVTDVINGIGKERFYAGALKLNESEQKGNYYGIPYHGWVQGIWYRADWFDQAGLKPPETWEDMEKAAKTFYNPEKNQYGILVGTKAEVYSEQCFTPIAMSNGAGLFDKEGNLIFNSPEMKEAIEFYARLAQYNPPGPQTWRARDYYLQGKMAGFFYSTYIMDDLALAEVAAGSLTSENFAELTGGTFDPELVEKTRLSPIVTHKSSAGFGVVVSFSLPDHGDAAKTKAAQTLLNYLFTPNAYITWLHMAPGGMNPVLREIATNERFQNDPKGIFKHYGKEKMAEIIAGLDKIETFSIVEGNRIAAASTIYAKQIIPQMLYKITQEGMDIDAAMAWAEEEMRKLQ